MGDVLYRNLRIATLNPAQPGLGVIETGAILVQDGQIAYVGPEAEAPTTELSDRVDGAGRWVTPGFVDCHTHLIYGGDRTREFEMRRQGVPYAEIAAAGGGIVATVAATNALDEAGLIRTALPRLDALIGDGVTTVEIKSGYGLNIEAELRMLRAARALERHRQVRVVTTWLAAHATPPAYRGRTDAYLDEVVLAGLRRAHAEGLVDAVDGFCETIAFSVQDMRRVFDLATSLGLPVKLHAEQLSNLGGARMAAGYHALSCDHLEHLDDAGARDLAAAGTVAVLLPGAFYTLRERQAPPIAALRAAGAVIALASDCNPGTSPLTSILLAMNMGATLFGLTVEDCLVATTRAAAQALGRAGTLGTIAVGQSADFNIWDIEHPAELVYRLGFNPLHARVFRGQRSSL